MANPGNGRRLAESVSFEYTITVANATVAASIAEQIKTTNVTDLAAKIVSHLPSNSTFKSLEVTAVTSEAATITTTTTIGQKAGGGDEFDDSHARTPAALGSLAMAVIAASLTLSN